MPTITPAQPWILSGLLGLFGKFGRQAPVVEDTPARKVSRKEALALKTLESFRELLVQPFVVGAEGIPRSEL